MAHAVQHCMCALDWQTTEIEDHHPQFQPGTKHETKSLKGITALELHGIMFAAADEARIVTAVMHACG